MGFFPYMGGILWGFLTFMEGFPIPPLSLRARGPSGPAARGRSGGGWGIYVAVVVINKGQTLSDQGAESRRDLILGVLNTPKTYNRLDNPILVELLNFIWCRRSGT